MGSHGYALLRDDIDGGAAVETIRFGLDGVLYEIDLSKRNARKLRRVYRCYTTAGRRVGGKSIRSAAPASTGHDQPAAIRRWAREHGIAVKARGRLPSVLVERYRAAGQR